MTEVNGADKKDAINNNAEEIPELNKIDERKERQIDEREKRIRAITQIYYSNPKVQEAILEFSKQREVVPRYYESFGKRPDTLQYSSDITELVKKGATSFHASEELWADPLQISSDMSQEEMSDLRGGWDLVIDIDSSYLDCSKVAVKLMILALEEQGIKNYGVKFSGNKGFHILISKNAFPKELGEFETRKMFPEWARAIAEYLTNKIRPDYNREVGKMMGGAEIKTIEEKTKDKIVEVVCPECGRESKKGDIVKYSCHICKMKIERKDPKISKRRMRCLNNKCAGVLEIEKIKNYYYCEHCDISSFKKNAKEEWNEQIIAGKIAALDLVLVSPRHLFRVPYSLHEKTALASVVITKDEIENFSPKDANPFNLKIKNFLPNNFENEGLELLKSAIEWKKGNSSEEERVQNKRYGNYKGKEIDLSDISEDDFPTPIKKLLKGLREGKKRGLFILLTFLRSLNFSPEYINNKIREWNKLNEPQLKEGYVKSQIDWHLKQKKKILPPNYDNAAFYKDLGLIEGKSEAKNPLVEVARKIRARQEKY